MSQSPNRRQRNNKGKLLYLHCITYTVKYQDCLHLQCIKHSLYITYRLSHCDFTHWLEKSCCEASHCCVLLLMIMWIFSTRNRSCGSYFRVFSHLWCSSSFNLDSGSFYTLVWFICADVNTVIKTLWTGWSRAVCL